MAAEKSDLVDLEVWVHELRDKAVRVSSDETAPAGVWLPLSLVEIDNPGNKSGPRAAEITLPLWLAQDRGLA